MGLHRKASFIVAGVATAALLAGGTMVAHADETGSGTPPAAAVDSGADLNAQAISIGDALRACRAWFRAAFPTVGTEFEAITVEDEDHHLIVGGFPVPDNHRVDSFGINQPAPGEGAEANNRHARIEISHDEIIRWIREIEPDRPVRGEIWLEGRHGQADNIAVSHRGTGIENSCQMIR